MENLHFNVVDIAVLVILLLSVIRGIMKGLSGELADLISAAVAVYAGWYFYEPAGAWIAENTRLDAGAAFPLAFFLLLIAGYILMRLLRVLLRSIMEFSFKGGIERVGGALAALVRAGVLCAAGLLFLGLWPNEFIHQLVAEDSWAGRVTFEKLGPVYENLAEQYPSLRFPFEEEEPRAEGAEETPKQGPEEMPLGPVDDPSRERPETIDNIYEDAQ